jgi:drug/metabolite transporter (DMT)-like permease
MTQHKALGALAGFGMMWALTIPLTKVAVSSGHPVIGLIFWQLLISAVIIGVILRMRGRSLRYDRAALRHYLVIALIGTILPNSFSYLAAAQLPAGIMAITIATVPMFALLVSLLLRVERLAMRRLAGVLLGALAVIILVGPDASLPEPEKAIFVLVALVATCCYGLEGNYVALWSPSAMDPMSTICGASIIGTLLAGLGAWWTGGWVSLPGVWAAPEKALVTSSLIHAFVYSGYIWLVGVTSPVFASQIAYVVTLGGVFFSALLLGESYSAWVFLSLLLMIAGLFLVQPRQRVSLGPVS